MYKNYFQEKYVSKLFNIYNITSILSSYIHLSIQIWSFLFNKNISLVTSKSLFSGILKFYGVYDFLTTRYLSRLVTKPTMWLCVQRRLRSAWASASLIRVFAVRMKKALVLSYPFKRTAKTLIRLNGCTG